MSRGRGTRRKHDDVLDDWFMLASSVSEDVRQEEIAGRMGMSLKALRRALTRARQRQDPRAVFHTRYKSQLT